MENTEKKGNAWTNFVKDWAATNNMKYMVAIKDEEVKKAYKDSKKQKKKLVIVDNFEKLKGDAVAMAEAIDPPPVKKKAGRPSKYANDEERKEAKRLKTLASNKKKREEIQAKKKEGTMTVDESEKYYADSAANVERTIKMRAKKRAEAIVKYEGVYNKMRNYIKDNEKEYFKNFSKDPFYHRWGDRRGWKPTGKYQERAVEIFGEDTPATYSMSLERHILTKDELDLLSNEKNHIPNFEYGWDKAKQDIDELKGKLASKISVIQHKDDKGKRKEIEGMMEDDPHEKRKRLKLKAEYEIKEKEKEKQRQLDNKKRDEAEKVRRSLLSPHQRDAEDKETKRFYDMIMRGSGSLGGDKGKRWVSLVDKGFWN